LTQDADRTNLDDASAHYGLDHRSTMTPAPRAEKTREQRRIEYAQRTGTPIDEKTRLIVALPDSALDVDPELVGKSPEEVSRILAERESHRNGCNDPKCSRCSSVDERMLRGNHVTTGGGGSGGGRRQRRKGGGFSRTEPAMAHVYEDEIGKDLRPRNVAGRVSNEAYQALYADGNPSPGEMLEVVGRALHHGVPWQRIADAIENL
jgi:hypothetical protein